MNEQVTENTCLECGSKLFGRSDKRYCNDSCRNAHHNRLHRSANNYMRKVNRILSRNRAILLELNPGETTKVSRRKLASEGFNFDFFTNVYQTKNQKTYRFCYDQGYLELGNDQFALVTKKEYV